MPRELTRGPTLRDIRRDVPQESESYSSIRANPSVSPYASRDGSPVPSDRATGHLTTDVSNCSLSVNYFPSKFSSGILVGGGGGEARKRPVTLDSIDFLGLPKMGGGIDVFKSGEARMGGEGDGDDDDDYVCIDDGNNDGRRPTKKWFARGRKQNSPMHNRKLRWNKFKWILFISNTVVSLLSFILQNLI